MKNLPLTVAVAVCLIGYVVAYPKTEKVLKSLKGKTGKDDIRKKDGFEYLRKYGRLNHFPKAMTWADYEECIKKLQKMLGVPQTGIIDDRTYEMMHRGRCGNPDGHVYSIEDEADWDEENGLDEGPTVKRYATSAYSWPWSDLTYKVTGYKAGMTEADFDEAIFNATQKWAAVTTLKFTPTKCNKKDMEIYFGPHLHDCTIPFDSRTLAHSFLPSYSIDAISGDVHLNELKTWAVHPVHDGRDIFDMEAVILHELGHALGLGHSDVNDTVMNPVYEHFYHGILQADDIAAIQSKYGDENTPYGEKRKPALRQSCMDTAKQFF